MIHDDYAKRYIREDHTGAYETFYSIFNNKSETFDQIKSDLEGQVSESKIIHHLKKLVGYNILLKDISGKKATFKPMPGLSQDFVKEIYNMRNVLKH